MLTSSPSIYVTGGKLEMDFRPQIVEGPAKFSFKVVKNGADVELKSSERKAVVRGFELLKARPERLKNTQWKIGQLEMVVFWEFFDTSYERKKPFMEILPGLNIFVLEADWGGLAQSKSHGWRHWHNSSGLSEKELNNLACLKKDSKLSDNLWALEMKLGKKLQSYYLLGNWVEWKIIELTLGRSPAFAIPGSGIMNRDERLIVFGTKQSLEWGMNTGLRGKPEEVREIMAYTDKLLKARYIPQQALARLIKMCWEACPIWSSVHDGIEHWFIQEIYRTLKVAARAVDRERGS